MSVYDKLLTIQTELDAPKKHFNPFGKYYYRSCEDICEGLKPILTEIKATVTLSDAVEMVGNRFYIKATATLYDLESGESISNTAYAREDESKKGMDACQVTGTASSYARKYALGGLLCIDDEKDSDATNEETKDGRQGAAKSTPKEEKRSAPKQEKTPEEKSQARRQMTRQEMIDFINLICFRYSANNFSSQLFGHLGIDSFEGQGNDIVAKAYALAVTYDRQKSEEAKK